MEFSGIDGQFNALVLHLGKLLTKLGVLNDHAQELSAALPRVPHLSSIVAAGAVNVGLVAFVADRLTPKGSAPVITTGELAVVNDNAPVAATTKLAA